MSTISIIVPNGTDRKSFLKDVFSTLDAGNDVAFIEANGTASWIDTVSADDTLELVVTPATNAELCSDSSATIKLVSGGMQKIPRIKGITASGSNLGAASYITVSLAE